MKHSRHPLSWRVDSARATLVLGVTFLGLYGSTLAAKPQPPSAMESPSVDIPVITPNIGVSSPQIPGFTMPTMTPTLPSASSQAPQLNAARRGHELKVSEYRRNRELHTSHPDRIEYAEALIHLERYDEAIEELEAIEEKYSGAYSNAHLLGIACELSGNLPAARRWFSAALERDPDAQEGTGWLRVAMIEAHLALRKDPSWLETHSVLDDCASRSEGELVRAVDIQVEGRRDFFAADDPVLADLYFQLGVRMTAPETRNKYFALSLDVSPLRESDIGEHQVVRAQGPASSSEH